MNLLEVKDIVARHGLLTAVREVSLNVEEGEALAIIGANGAGKTTLFRAIAGAHPADSGSIRLAGADVTALRAPQRVAAGIAMVPEGRRLFGDMTVRENLQIAGENGRTGDWTLDGVLESFPDMKRLLPLPADALSGGQRQAVAIGRALMSNPKVLLLDEVSLGLSPIAAENLYVSLRALKQSGTTMVVVEQDLDRALGFADRVVCMLEGKVMLEGRPGDFDRAQITAAYFGFDESHQGEH
jgi:branched-chain amino acid transport system ATP-binding protein